MSNSTNYGCRFIIVPRSRYFYAKNNGEDDSVNSWQFFCLCMLNNVDQKMFIHNLNEYLWSA